MKHAHWSAKLQDLADIYIRDTLDLAQSDPIPPVCAVALELVPDPL
jgi:hypothetical protein